MKEGLPGEEQSGFLSSNNDSLTYWHRVLCVSMSGDSYLTGIAIA